MTVTAGDTKVLVSISGPSGCLAPPAKLDATLKATTIAGSTGSRAKFVKAQFFIDRGTRHVHHRRVRRHGQTVTVTTISYTPNRTITTPPANLSFGLAGLKPGTHTLKIKVEFHETVQGHTRTVTKTVTHMFSVCAK